MCIFCQPVAKWAGSFQIIIIFHVFNSTLPLPAEILKNHYIMIKITYQEGNMSISYDLQGEPSQKEIIGATIFVLERALGECSVLKHLKDFVGDE